MIKEFRTPIWNDNMMDKIVEEAVAYYSDCDYDDYTLRYCICTLIISAIMDQDVWVDSVLTREYLTEYLGKEFIDNLCNIAMWLYKKEIEK